ncbi:DUF4976 domain-containing protein [bacterium]|nr:DUF4976 domain-containing protein [bacterium]
MSDLYTTVLELAGVYCNEQKCDSFLSLCDIANILGREFTISENTAPKSLNNMRSWAIRGDRYKFIWNSNGKHELYDLEVDPGELHNISHLQPAIAAQLERKLNDWKRRNRDFGLERQSANLDQQITERLRALGYMD